MNKSLVISEMTPAELSNGIALKVMEWKKCEYPSAYEGWPTWKVWRDWNGNIVDDFSPANNYTHCSIAEERIKEFGLTEEYIDNLLETVRGDGWPEDYIFDLVHATCAQKCKAMLVTVLNE